MRRAGGSRSGADLSDRAPPARSEAGLAADRDSYVREGRVGRRAMPVLLAGRNDHEVAGPDADFLRLGGDDALAGRDIEHLVEVVHVEDVDRALVEVDEVGAQ